MEDLSSISWEEFQTAVNAKFGSEESSKTASYDQYYRFVKGIPKGNITSKREAAMALAQFLHESGDLECKREHVPEYFRCGRRGCSTCTRCYENLGRHYRKKGDPEGKQYYGRGMIQLTGYENYLAANNDLKLRGHKDIVEYPDLVADDENVCWATAFSYWKRAVHTSPGVAEGHFGSTTRAINGALECDGKNTPLAKKRFDIYCKVYKAFNLEKHFGKPNPYGCYNDKG